MTQALGDDALLLNIEPKNIDQDAVGMIQEQPFQIRVDAESNDILLRMAILKFKPRIAAICKMDQVTFKYHGRSIIGSETLRGNFVKDNDHLIMEFVPNGNKLIGRMKTVIAKPLPDPIFAPKSCSDSESSKGGSCDESDNQSAFSGQTEENPEGRLADDLQGACESSELFYLPLSLHCLIMRP